MNESSVVQADLRSGFKARSMGMKLMLVCALGLVMAIPALFVQGLVDERSPRAADGTQEAINQTLVQHTILGTSIKVVDTYRSVDRSLKYVLLFLGLVFLTYFIFEVTTGKRVHPAQYVLVGTAQIIFYLLLLSLAEKIGFDFAFLLAGGGTVALLSTNAKWIFNSRVQGIRAAIVFSLLYLLIYLLLRLEDDALLIGAISSFIAVAAAMYFTRGIDWYSSMPLTVADEQRATELMPKDAD